MNKFAATLCIVGTALALSACETGTTFDSGANYATSRTAGQMDQVDNVKPMQSERVFREVQTK
ncbi:MAG: hypothetical protein KDJ35_08220 [Alphaproteobacteria bacterium]|nr:hypothetical protein [Alphaproteobacteria bacterium]